MSRSITSQIPLRVKLTAIVALLAFSTALMIPADAAAQPGISQRASSGTTMVTGTASNGSIFSGTLKLTSVAANANGLLTATGSLSGVLTNAAGQVLQTISNATVSGLQILSASASCQILNLSIGAIDLNLLGLVVHVNPILVTITAVPGAGNLLGNLLCDVANLLNGGNLSNLLGSLVSDLNAILGML